MLGWLLKTFSLTVKSTCWNGVRTITNTARYCDKDRWRVSSATKLITIQTTDRALTLSSMTTFWWAKSILQARKPNLEAIKTRMTFKKRRPTLWTLVLGTWVKQMKNLTTQTHHSISVFLHKKNMKKRYKKVWAFKLSSSSKTFWYISANIQFTTTRSWTSRVEVSLLTNHLL